MTASNEAGDLVRALEHLQSIDPAIGRLHEQFGAPRLHRGRGSAFEALARSIAYQQLAGAAASTIYGRFRALISGPVNPKNVLALSEDEMRGAGLSGAKTASIRDLATRAGTGELRLGGLSRLGDDEVIDRLVTVRGIGTWTAQMFLLGHLARPDVWPTGDLGVRKGFGRIFGHEPMPTPVELDELGERFRPYRSLVARYCWLVVDTPTAL